MSEGLKRMMDDWHEQRIIRCPYCKAEYVNDDGSYPVTYHGRGAESVVEIECDECGGKYTGEEHVSRTYVMQPHTMKKCDLCGEDMEWDREPRAWFCGCATKDAE